MATVKYDLIARGVTPDNFGAGAPGGFAGMLDRFSRGFGVGMGRYQNLGNSLLNYQDRTIQSGLARNIARDALMDSAQTRATKTMNNSRGEIDAYKLLKRAQLCVDPNSKECIEYTRLLDAQEAQQSMGLTPYTEGEIGVQDAEREDYTNSLGDWNG